MIHTSSEPSLDIPDTDVTSFVLGEAQARGDAEALVDGPTGRVVTYAGPRRRPGGP